VLRKENHLKVEIGMLSVGGGHAVLPDEDEMLPIGNGWKKSGRSAELQLIGNEQQLRSKAYSNL